MANRLLLDGQALALALDVSEQTIRRWASSVRGRGGPYIHARGRDSAGRNLYDVDEVQAFAATRRPRAKRQLPPT